jgi:hypothetical protein
MSNVTVKCLNFVTLPSAMLLHKSPSAMFLPYTHLRTFNCSRTIAVHKAQGRAILWPGRNPYCCGEHRSQLISQIAHRCVQRDALMHRELTALCHIRLLLIAFQSPLSLKPFTFLTFNFPLRSKATVPVPRLLNLQVQISLFFFFKHTPPC